MSLFFVWCMSLCCLFGACLCCSFCTSLYCFFRRCHYSIFGACLRCVFPARNGFSLFGIRHITVFMRMNWIIIWSRIRKQVRIREAILNRKHYQIYIRVGCALGIVLGKADGTPLGPADGIFDGKFVGTALGVTDGPSTKQRFKLLEFPNDTIDLTFYRLSKFQ